jgi:hypothetical protein
MNARISNHLRRMNFSNIISVSEASYPAEHIESPPDYETAVKIKEAEADELPSYTEAVLKEDPASEYV